MKIAKNRFFGYSVVIGLTLALATTGDKIRDLLPQPNLPLQADQAAAYVLAAFYLLASASTFRLSFTPASAKFGHTPAQGRKNCQLSALGMATIVVLLPILAGSGPCGYVPKIITMVATAFAAITGIAISIYLMRNYPIRHRRMLMRSSLAAMNIGFPLLILWTGFAQAGLDVGFTPLGILSASIALILIGASAAETSKKKH